MHETKRMFALCFHDTGGQPHSLDPSTLETRGLETFDGLMNGKRTMAHMRHDHEQNTLLVVNVKFGRQTHLEIYEFDQESKVRFCYYFFVDRFFCFFLPYLTVTEKFVVFEKLNSKIRGVSLL